MAERYIPPAMRRRIELDQHKTVDKTAKAEHPASSNEENTLFSTSDINYHFWPLGTQSTMHDSAAIPGQLAYFLLFDGANPRWDQDQIVYTKSNLELLTHYEDLADSKASDTSKHEAQASTTSNASPEEPSKPAASAFDSELNTRETAASRPIHGSKLPDRQILLTPIAVFEQTPALDQRCMKFVGWYKIQRIAYLEPHTEELIQMLEQKWTRLDRHGHSETLKRGRAAWEESLRLKWAAINFEKVSNAERERGRPRIERLEDEPGDGPKKSVNELLAEMRLGSASKEKPDGPAK